jgi:ubiquinone/menaquinone biosynthesis C-methylase UbiE
MASNADLSIETRILNVLQHVGIAKAHVAARDLRDWQGLAASHADRLASLTLVCPPAIAPQALAPLAERSLVITGDRGQPTEHAQRVVAMFPSVSRLALADYNPTPYMDLLQERPDEIGSPMLDFLSRMDAAEPLPSLSPPESEGEIDDVIYQLRGSGAPLVLLPLSVAPSQWEPLLPKLSARYCVITLRGPWLGMVGSLESRGHMAGYLRSVGNLLDAAALRPGETALEVGCGTGVLDRWLAQRTHGANRLVAMDVNPYLLREAEDLSRREGLAHIIEFNHGSGEQLPYPDHHFDVTWSSTVIQRLDADRMLAEMARVTKPGGRVAVLGHAHDMPQWLNLPLPAELKTRLEAPGWDGVNSHPQGCHEASLYARFQRAGLKSIKMFPQLAEFTTPDRLQQIQAAIVPTLNPEETDIWRRAVAQAEAEGTFFVTRPYHCAVGTKP